MTITLGPPDPLTIHWSDIQTFTQCRRKWNYASHLRRGLEWRRLYAPFFIGSATHHALENLRKLGLTADDSLQEFMAQQLDRMSAGKGVEAMWEEEIAAAQEHIDFVASMIDHYLMWERHYTGPFKKSEIEFISHERTFRVPLLYPAGHPFEGKEVPGVLLEGRIDGLIRHLPTGEIWLYEIKTARSIHERTRLLPNDGQASMYCLAAEQTFGEPVAGVIYDILRKALPKEPDVLAGGFLSKNKRIDTSFESYLDCIRAHHGPNATAEFIKVYYGDFLNHLLDKGNQFFARVPVRRSRNELGRFHRELFLVAMEMVRPDIPIWASPGWSCGFCPFYDPCIARNQGDPAAEVTEDEALLLEANYRVRDMHAAYGDVDMES